MKEIFIAIVYTIGVLLPSISVTQQPMHNWPWLIIISFSVTALINLILFSWFDHARDLHDGNISFVTVLGEQTSRTVIVLLFLLVMVLVAAHLYFSSVFFHTRSLPHPGRFCLYAAHSIPFILV